MFFEDVDPATTGSEAEETPAMETPVEGTDAPAEDHNGGEAEATPAE